MNLSYQPSDKEFSVRRDGAGTAVDQVYGHLRERILSFDLPPDATLHRSELAHDYGVSQTPVREALQRLEQDGLVQIFPQSKTIVSRIDLRDLRETHFFRVALETEAVRRLAQMDNKEVVKRAQTILNLQKALVGQDDQMDLFTDLDRSFHLALFEAVAMERIHVMMSRRLGHLARCQRLELPMQGKMEWIIGGHQAILDGIAAGDPNAAADAMRAHISGTIQRISALKDEFPDYFIGK